MLRWFKRLTAPLVAVALLGMAPATRADTINVSLVSHIGAVFIYGASETAVGAVKAGDGFTIPDFAGPVLVVLSDIVHWKYVPTLSGSPVSGGIGALIAPNDDPTIPNLNFVWIGAPTPGALVAPATFTVTTSAPGVSSEFAYSHDSSVSDLVYGFGPLPVAAAVPLPATANMGLALIACVAGLSAWKRLRSTQEVV